MYANEELPRWAGRICLLLVAAFGMLGFHYANVRFIPMMAGFAEIRNPCAEPVRIVAARSPAFGAVELHETTRVDGVSRMRHVEALDVPARGTVVLAPGGLHLMLMQPKDEAVEGSTLEVELELDDGRRLAAGFQVRAPGAL